MLISPFLRNLSEDEKFGVDRLKHLHLDRNSSFLSCFGRNLNSGPDHEMDPGQSIVRAPVVVFHVELVDSFGRHIVDPCNPSPNVS